MTPEQIAKLPLLVIALIALKVLFFYPMGAVLRKWAIEVGLAQAPHILDGRREFLRRFWKDFWSGLLLFPFWHVFLHWRVLRSLT